MGIKVSWENTNDNSIRWDFDGSWNNYDLVDAEHMTAILAAQTSGTVDLILNMESVRTFSGDFVFFRNTIKRISRNVGLKIIAGESPLLRRFLETFGHYDIEFVEGLTLLPSMAEARELLAT